MVDTTHIRIGILTASDRATSGEYEDLSGPEIQCLLDEILTNPIDFHRRLVPDNIEEISDALIELCDDLGCALILTTGGTGPAPRDVTPEATRASAMGPAWVRREDEVDLLEVRAHGDPVQTGRGNEGPA